MLTIYKKSMRTSFFNSVVFASVDTSVMIGCVTLCTTLASSLLQPQLPFSICLELSRWMFLMCDHLFLCQYPNCRWFFHYPRCLKYWNKIVTFENWIKHTTTKQILVYVIIQNPNFLKRIVIQMKGDITIILQWTCIQTLTNKYETPFRRWSKWCYSKKFSDFENDLENWNFGKKEGNFFDWIYCDGFIDIVHAVSNMKKIDYKKEEWSVKVMWTIQ